MKGGGGGGGRGTVPPPPPHGTVSNSGDIRRKFGQIIGQHSGKFGQIQEEIGYIQFGRYSGEIRANHRATFGQIREEELDTSNSGDIRGKFGQIIGQHSGKFRKKSGKDSGEKTL